MKKKRITKKLELNKETIANLNTMEMNQIVGGETQAGSGFPVANTCTIATKPTRAGNTCPIRECIHR